MRAFLSGESRAFFRVRRMFRSVPSGPHCKLCAAPFEGPGGLVLRHVGFARYAGNPDICNSCIKGGHRERPSRLGRAPSHAAVACVRPPADDRVWQGRSRYPDAV